MEKSAIVEDAKKSDEKTRKKKKVQYDKENSVQDPKIESGDSVLVKQNKSATKPPFDPVPYSVEDVKKNRLPLKRGEKVIKRAANKVKKLMKLPEHFEYKNKEVLDDDFSDTDFEINPEKAHSVERDSSEDDEIPDISTSQLVTGAENNENDDIESSNVENMTKINLNHSESMSNDLELF